jgi:DNA topoisomerase-2
VAGTVNGVKVSLNGKLISVKDFKAYVALYTSAAAASAAAAGAGAPLVGASPTSARTSIIYERFHERWEVAFAISEGSFQQVSFVNSIATTKGGTHVDHVSKQIVEALIDAVKKKNKAAPLKPQQVRRAGRLLSAAFRRRRARTGQEPPLAVCQLPHREPGV